MTGWPMNQALGPNIEIAINKAIEEVKKGKK